MANTITRTDLDFWTQELQTTTNELAAVRADEEMAGSLYEAYVAMSVTVANNEVRRLNGLHREYKLV